MSNTLLSFVHAAAIIIAAIASVIGLLAAWRKFQTEHKRSALVKAEYANKFLKQFNDAEIRRSLSGYVVPQCSPGDPNNKDGEEFLADTREPIFAYMDRNLEEIGRGYHLLLADTGMGKTSFCLNYFAHLRKKFPLNNVCLISLASKDYEGIIKSVGNKSDSILIADAFDEDRKSSGRGRERLSELLELVADFKFVIITCRSQYFLSDDAIPRETPLPVLIPRQLGQSPTFPLVRSYISPFSKAEITHYISKHFPILFFWRIRARRRAWDLVRSVPDLAYRPMLLERLPDLAKERASSHELYDLYKLLVEGWITRESRWISSENLKAVSTELALQMYAEFDEKSGRLKPEQIQLVAEEKLGKSPDWTHLTSRSLLNRDSRGNYKFAHRSILEFLVVKAACEGNDRAFNHPWTSFMKEVFVSWGHTDDGRKKWRRAQAILSSANGRRNIAPLFDMLGTAAVRGVPDFKRCCDQKLTATGERLAPASWRSSSIDLSNDLGRGIINIRDAEYNLDWIYIPPGDEVRLSVTLVEAMQFMQARPDYTLPSFEQFIALVEGLYRIKNNIIPHGALFVVGDRPAKHEHIIVQLNSNVIENQYLKCLDKNRRIVGTNIYVNSYLTGLKISTQFARNVILQQLYIAEDNPNLF